jgi:hypothetical protein
VNIPLFLVRGVKEENMTKFDGFFVVCALGFLIVMLVLGIIGQREGDVRLPVIRCSDLLVDLVEYKTVVKSLDLCNERLHQVVVDAYENDYEIQQNSVVERFQPDTPEAEDIAICRECSANCEEALQWCYFYRGESCFCLDEEEEW